MVKPVSIINTSFRYTSSWYTLWLTNWDSLLQTLTSIIWLCKRRVFQTCGACETLLHCIFWCFETWHCDTRNGFSVSGREWADWGIKKVLAGFPLLSSRRFSLVCYFTVRSIVFFFARPRARQRPVVNKLYFNDYFNSLLHFSFYLFASCKIYRPHSNPTDC